MQWISSSIFNCLTILLSTFRSTSALETSTEVLKEYCLTEMFNASCGSDEVILMTNAMYGRMRIGRCVGNMDFYLGCSSVVLPLLDDRCSGRKTCTLMILDPSLHDILPCPTELKTYLEASYSCIPVAIASKETCALFGGQPLLALAGHVSSGSIIQSGVGLKDCPWMIESRDGQKINLFLYSFSSTRNLTSVCPWTIIVSEGNKTDALAACSEVLVRRNRLVYTSVGHMLHFHLIASTDLRRAESDVRLLIKYQVFGCADETSASVKNARISRKGDKTTVSCLNSDKQSILTCINNTWIGHVVQCNGSDTSLETGIVGLQNSTTCSCNQVQKVTADKEMGHSARQYELIAVGSIGVVIGMILGILFLLAAIFCYSRHRNKQLTRRAAVLLLENDVTSSGSVLYRA